MFMCTYYTTIFILVTTSKYVYVHICQTLLTLMKLTQALVNLKSHFQRQILLNEHSR